METEPQAEHRWLQKLVGDWTFEGECSMGPDQPPMKSEGREVVRSLGKLWTIGEGEGPASDEGACRSVMTLGYDPTSNRFVGTFIASTLAHLWSYSGSLDESGRVLALDTEGPSFTGQGMAKYRDCIEFIDDDHRVLTSDVQGEDGQWHRFMTAHYRRKH